MASSDHRGNGIPTVTVTSQKVRDWLAPAEPFQFSSNPNFSAFSLLLLSHKTLCALDLPRRGGKSSIPGGLFAYELLVQMSDAASEQGRTAESKAFNAGAITRSARFKGISVPIPTRFSGAPTFRCQTLFAGLTRHVHPVKQHLLHCCVRRPEGHFTRFRA